MLKLATLIDNPGEPQADTRYRDPQHLKDLGYTGRVMYATTGLSGVDAPDSVGTGEMRRFVEQQFDRATHTIDISKKVGLQMHITYDVLSLPRLVVEKDEPSLTCKGRPGMLCPASDAALTRSAEALRAHLMRWPQLDGVVLRFGDNDAARLPYLIGNDIYQPHCPRCAHLGRVDRIVRVLRKFHDLVVGQFNKRLIARAWNVRPNGMHDSVDVCNRLRDQLPGADNTSDPRFILSFKFTETDFWRYQKWNPASLVFGDRPIIYELQCQREFEGKGGVPNWQVPLWRDGYPETRDANGAENAGLANVARKVNLVGLWAWVRGGGWGGPFIKNETWVDANVVAVPQLADKPDIEPATIAENWIRKKLGLSELHQINTLKQVLMNSSQVALEGFYIGPFAKGRTSPWHPNGDLIQDDLIDAEAAWRMIQRLPESQLDEVVAEKQRAVDTLSKDQSALHHLITEGNRSVLEPLSNTMLYADSLFRMLGNLLAGLAAYRRFLKRKETAQASLCKQKLLAAQSDWTHHTQRYGALAGAATAFRESNFWDLTQQILGEL
ncbi:MAG: hypothetical protein WD768_13130 [Phycisphaeraceae bacterium]